MQKVVVTGAAGFIGYHVSQRLLAEGCEVLGIDRVDSYYDPALKEARLARLSGQPGFRFSRHDLADPSSLDVCLQGGTPDAFIHLAAQPGVRFSIEQPREYLHSNLAAFLNVLEWCRHHECPHLVYASSSSVYGAETDMPYRESMPASHPKSFYGATKRCNELMAHSYADLYGLPVTGLRFFTVYGPWGRPDMAPILFARKILAGQAIDVFNEGNLSRDFTYVDDIVEGIVRVAAQPATPNPDWDGAHPDPGSSYAPYRVYNIGNGAPVNLMRFIEVLGESLGCEVQKRYLPMQKGDVYHTFADSSRLQEAVHYRPRVSLEEGIPRFVEWLREYYG